MIKSFKSKEAAKIYQGRYSRRIPKDIQHLASRKLEILAAASELKSLRIPPSNGLEKLRGDRTGQYGIRINDQWRICFICFIWKAGDAHQVDIVDCH